MSTKMLVVSDSHGEREILADLLAKYANKVDVLFHCGDSELEPDDELFKIFHVVKGNCDFDSRFLEKEVVKLAGETILVTHGHLYGVSSGLNSIGLLAKENNADFAFFGHTHQLGAEMINGCLFLNPGSIGFPRGKYSYIGGTYAIIEADEKNIKVQFYNRDFEPIPSLQVDYQRS
ncbi:metallophosphoesterase [Liquorilactobacillus cacaonum]|nr:metallophosphoesterase [Liquorilactobacillus cacaonum]